MLHERGVRESREDEQEVRELRERLDEKEEELAVRLAEHKRAVAKFRKENADLQLEFEKARNAAKHSRAKLAQVENELAICRKRLQLAKTRPGTPLDDSSNRPVRRPARPESGASVRSRSPAQNRAGSADSARKRRPQSAPIRGGSSGSESERPTRERYGRSPSPAQKRRGASPSLTRPTSGVPSVSVCLCLSLSVSDSVRLSQPTGGDARKWPGVNVSASANSRSAIASLPAAMAVRSGRFF